MHSIAKSLFSWFWMVLNQLEVTSDTWNVMKHDETWWNVMRHVESMSGSDLTAEVCPAQHSGDSNGEDPKPGECAQRSQRLSGRPGKTQSADDFHGFSTFCTEDTRYSTRHRSKLHKKNATQSLGWRISEMIRSDSIPNSHSLAGQAADNRDALAKVVYDIVFNYIVRLGLQDVARCCKMLQAQNSRSGRYPRSASTTDTT